MDARSGYLIKTESLADLSRFLDAVRSDLLRVFRLQYGRTIAAEAARLADLHRIGLSPRDPEESPLADAARVIRAEWKAARTRGIWHPDIDFAVFLHLSGDDVLARVVCGATPYRKTWEARSEVTRFAWEDGQRPRSVPAAEWERRRRIWERVLAPPAIARGLRLSVLDNALPAMKPSAVRRCAPRRDRRVKVAARAVALRKALGMDPFRGPLPEAAARWLRSEAGRAAWAAAERRLHVDMLDVTGADDLGRYGESGVQITNPAAAPAEWASPRMIDHADVVEGSDGNVFVAVLDGGLASGSRVFIQVGDAHLSIIQDGVQYGHVEAVSRFALDLLRAFQTATLVEVQENGERRSLKAKHVAIVMDVGLADTFRESMSRWRKPSSATNQGERQAWLQE